VKKEIVEKLNTLMTAAFGLVAALAWNDTIKAIFKQVFPSPENNVIAMLIYAVVVTIVAVFVIVHIGKAAERVK
tara:strand:- start:3050 stop:3271 length:222 start_codon:yes stop_codon:yes gene_type:complete